MRLPSFIRGLLLLLSAALAIVVAVAFAFGREREYTIEGSMSPRIEGQWRIRHGGSDCGRDLSELEIHLDEWLVGYDRLDPLATGDHDALIAAYQLAHPLEDERWGKRPYNVFAKGRLRVGNVESPMRLALTADGRQSGQPWILVESVGPDGPLTGCGWGDRLSFFLRVSEGNITGEDGWSSDRLLVSFGQDENGGMRPHEYARASSD